MEGTTVIAKSAGKYSMYDKVQGTVTRHENGWMTVQAERVLVRGEDQWTDHPTQCSTSIREDDIINTLN